MENIIVLKQKNIRSIFKIFFSALLLVLVLKNALIDGLAPYYSYKDYNIRNISDPISTSEGASVIKQQFVSKGTLLKKINLYYQGEASAEDRFKIMLTGKNEAVLFEEEYQYAEYAPCAWNEIEVNLNKLSRGEEYVIRFYNGSANTSLVISDLNCDSNRVYKICDIDGREIEGFVSIGFQVTYQYITLGNVLFFAIRLLLILIFTLIALYAVLNIEKLCIVYHQGVDKKSFIYGFYFALYLLFLFNPMDVLRTEVISFTREIGAGLLAGYDASKVIGNFIWWFILSATMFTLYTLAANCFIVKEKTEEQEKVMAFLDKVFVLADVNLVLRSITFFYDEAQSDNIYYYSSIILAEIIVLSLIYIVFKMEQCIKAKEYYQLLFCTFTIAFPIAIMCKTEWESGKLLMGVQSILAMAVIAMFYVFRRQLGRLERIRLFDTAVIVAAIFPFFTSFYIEFINILNQYSIFVGRPRRYYAIGCALIVCIGCIVGIVASCKKWNLSWWKTWAYVWVIIGFVGLNQQIPLVNSYTPDLFEWANYSVLINGFLKFGEIPIVENLGHHMMLRVWAGIIYGIVNGDFAGAIVSPYSGILMIPHSLLFYFFIRIVWNEEIAFWVTLLFPFNVNWGYAWGMLVCLAVVAFAEKNTFQRAALLWLACVWCALNKVDIGVSFGIACLVTIMVYVLVKKKWEAIRTLLVTLLIIGSFFGCMWFTLCIVKEINPVKRLLEFIKLFAASINWTWNGIGDNANTVYAFAYMLIPFGVIISLIYAVFSKNFRENNDLSRWILLMMLGFAYFGNYSRALTRHSLREMNTGTVFWTAYVFLALFLSCLFKKRAMFIPMLTGLILLNTLFVTQKNFSARAIADTATAKVGSFTETWVPDRFADENIEYETYWKKLLRERKVEQRVQYSNEYKETIAPYRYVFGVLLDEDDSFLDFIYVSHLYAEFDRTDPVYAAQSPTMLSGELTQEYFIQEIEKNISNIPIALMPNASGYHSNMDGILLNYKYYKVAEFIYDNYRPLCDYGNFSVWCLNDRYDEMAGILEGKEMIGKINTEELTSYNCAMTFDNQKVVISSTDLNPYICGIERSIDLSVYEGMDVGIDIEYKSSAEGVVQLFFVTDADEEFSEGKRCVAVVDGSGKIHFNVPITKYTKLRLDTPAEGVLEISSIKLSAFNVGDSKMESLLMAEDYKTSDCDVIKKNGTLTMMATGDSPMLTDLQSALNLAIYDGMSVNVVVDYETKNPGDMKIYYTTNNGENFTENKCVISGISGTGTAYFKVPVTEYTRVRLDIPKGSEIRISDIRLQQQGKWSFIDWGYEPNLHKHSLNRLPLYWAELDKQKAVSNEVVMEAVFDKTRMYTFDEQPSFDAERGNYLLLNTAYNGHDMNGLIGNDDEFAAATLVLGTYQNGDFTETCRYEFTIREGEHGYLFRVSSDYYWMLGKVNAVRLECGEKLIGTQIKILQGD